MSLARLAPPVLLAPPAPLALMVPMVPPVPLAPLAPLVPMVTLVALKVLLVLLVHKVLVLVLIPAPSATMTPRLSLGKRLLMKSPCTAVAKPPLMRAPEQLAPVVTQVAASVPLLRQGSIPRPRKRLQMRTRAARIAALVMRSTPATLLLTGPWKPLTR